MTKIAVVYYSMYGHVRQMAEEVAKGVKASGASVEIYQIAETLSEEVLKKMGAPPKADHPVIDPHYLDQFDGILFGIPTRFGMMAAQVKALFDATGSHWSKGTLQRKFAGIFLSTGTQCGGQETTALTAVTQLTHHGMIFVPLGYSEPAIFEMNEVHGGSPYGAGTYAAGDGSRQPSKIELKMANTQGKNFGQIVSQYIQGEK